MHSLRVSGSERVRAKLDCPVVALAHEARAIGRYRDWLRRARLFVGRSDAIGKHHPELLRRLQSLLVELASALGVARPVANPENLCQLMLGVREPRACTVLGQF